MLMEMAQLQAFVAVAEAGGFSRAASLLYSTQPTISRQVKSLEKDLGKPLFDRLGRRVELTQFGRECLDHARAILAQVEALSQSAEQKSGTAAGVLRLGAADSVVLKHLPVLLRRFQSRHPAVRVHVRTAGSPDILSWVREGRVDAGVCMLPETLPDLVLRELWDDRFVAICPKDHALAGCKATLADFAAERQMSIQAGTLSHQVLTAVFHEAGLPMVPDMTFDNFQLIVDLVRAGMGVAIVSEDVAEGAIKRKHVGKIEIPEVEKVHRSLGLAHHADRAIDGTLAAFVEELDRM